MAALLPARMSALPSPRGMLDYGRRHTRLRTCMHATAAGEDADAHDDNDDTPDDDTEATALMMIVVFMLLLVCEARAS